MMVSMVIQPARLRKPDPEGAQSRVQKSRRISRTNPSKRQSKKPPLDLNTCTAELMAACTANATESPLLRLPPEIRLHIFELVIGDSRCIEIGYAHPGDKLPSSIPLRGSGEMIIPGPSVSGFYLPHKDDYEVFPRPHDAALQWASTLKIDSCRFHPLNRVSRQTYHESMVLPYRLHTFAFGNLSALGAWVNSLTSQQKVSVRSIFYADFDLEDVPVIADITLKELPGLNRVFLPRSVRASQSPQVVDWLASLHRRNLNLRFLERSNHICRYVKVSE